MSKKASSSKKAKSTKAKGGLMEKPKKKPVKVASKGAKPQKKAKSKVSDDDEFEDFGGDVDFQPDDLNVNLNEEEDDDGFYAGDDF